MSNVEKVVNKYVEKLFKNYGKDLVENSEIYSFPYNSTNLENFFQTKPTTKSTRIINNLSLLKTSFTHFPHSLLLLLLNNFIKEV